MGKKLYVGNLSYGVSNSDLEQQFGAHGTVQSAQIIIDRDTGRSKGFGFVDNDNSTRNPAYLTRPAQFLNSGSQTQLSYISLG